MYATPNNAICDDLFEYTENSETNHQCHTLSSGEAALVPMKPILKWAGGKSQMLSCLLPKVPRKYGKYIEPFFGGGALFFSLLPENSIIADSNPELINMYRQVSEHVEDVIFFLQKYENTKEFFYTVRDLDWQKLPASEAAARTIFLNKTCFNGLYRVNRQGHFNVPFGNYKKPNICDTKRLNATSDVLKKTTIVLGDYSSVLEQYAEAGDFIFLDPPYLPISENADFKRYTKEQFQKEDHEKLAALVKKLYQKGCFILLTNSNHPLVHELYADFKIDVIPTKRYISCSGSTRTGEDVVVTAFPVLRKQTVYVPPLAQQVMAYPPTRFMGSKNKLLSQIWNVASQFEFQTVADLFSGSGIVGYLFKSQGKSVISNDYMAMSSTFAKAMIENNSERLSDSEIQMLLHSVPATDHFVEKTFQGLYYTDEENQWIDRLRVNIADLKSPYKKAIAMTALIRSCLKKRPRGIFTYVGNRYNDGRIDLQKSFEQQFLEAVAIVNKAVFDNGKRCVALQGDAMDFTHTDVDLVYMDPPYFSPLSDNEYVRRYHFVEGLARSWQGVDIQEDTKTKKFKSYPTPFSTKSGAIFAFDALFQKFAKSILLISYSSNSQPSKEEIIELMQKYKTHVDVVPIDYKYFFGNQNNSRTHRNKVQEYLFVGY